MSGASILWWVFALGVGLALFVDLVLLQKRSRGVSIRQALLWLSVWVALAVAFCGAVHAFLGREKALQFLAGYLLEESLSVDNMFVFVVIFHYFGVPPAHQSRVLHATPLFAALLVVEFSDVVFALDSIPAVIAVTRDPFIVYTSNIFAVLGLRSLYFLLAQMTERIRHLKLGISAVLCFVGAKMLAEPFYEVPIGASLGVIAGLLAVSALASLAGPTDPRPRRSGP